jgi:hypothetical protein
MWTRLALLCGCAAVLPTAAWTQASEPRDLLLRVRANVTDTVARLPKYMCSLAIDRAQYSPDPNHAPSCDGLAAQRWKGQLKPRLVETDRVRLDVAIAAANEIYSWVGEDRFNDREVFDLVRQGALQTGGFSTFLATIFAGEDANFTYNGETERDGRKLTEFGFQVPMEKSRYFFGNRHQDTVTGYEGTFLADPDTGDLVRLLIRTNGLPASSGSCEATTALDYGRVRLNNSEFLLPREAILEILNIDGTELRNRTEFASCHEFHGESAMKFDEPTPEPGSDVPVKAATPLPLAAPAGLRFTVIFAQAINTETAAAGDRIQATLKTAIRDPSSEVVFVPPGAQVTARIVGLEHFHEPPAFVQMLIRLESVNVAGKQVPLSATMNRRRDGKPDTRMYRLDITPRSWVAFVPPPDVLNDPGIGALEFRSPKSNLVVPKGLESNWLTTSPCSSSVDSTGSVRPCGQ